MDIITGGVVVISLATVAIAAREVKRIEAREEVSLAVMQALQVDSGADHIAPKKE